MAWVRAWVLLVVSNLLLSAVAVVCLYIVTVVLSLCCAMTAERFPWWTLAAVFFLVGVSVSLLSWLLVPRIVRRMLFLQPLASSGRAALAGQIVAELSLRLGLPAPRIYQFPSPVPNALVLGTSRHSAFFLLSSTLLERTSDAELRAILAHEMGHIYSGDMVGMQLLQSVIILIALLSMRQPRSSAERKRAEPLRVLLRALFFFLSLPPLSGFLRRREIAADRFAAEQVGGAGMISALRNYAITPCNVSDPLASISPFSVKQDVFFGRASLEERIAALQKERI
ncbi:M48 family metalloprotease [Candidatus Igneacidithiobacillus taiwanensis]|uniref:M48 family metallopeptidase n=1 Tax=Candidatus Igneacidithiobacillus taiwanensis TaxID=1945924 RepID=UPI0028A23C0B|nr:M48 family metalloprotease [Candidatus Igneacidithiobacillus taiwanensis]MCE5359632.1 M48 family metalloprotease [Acidithiobacillus sp.]